MNNNTDSELMEPVMPPTPGSSWYWSMRFVIALVGWIGNGLVIYIIGRSSRLQVTSNWFVLSLALADLGVTLIVAVPEFFCSVFFQCNWWMIKVLYDVFLFASIQNLFTMTFDRYLTVVYPLQYQRFMTTSRLIAILTTSWVTSVFIPLPYYVALRMKKFLLFATLQMLVRLFLEIIPCFLLLITYLHMVYIARKQYRRVEQQRLQLSYNYNVVNQDYCTRPKGSTRAIGCVVLIFEFCYAIAAYKGYLNYVKFEKVPDVMVGVARMLYHLNSAANCIVYALFRKDIRNKIAQIFKCDKRMNLEPVARIPTVTKNKESTLESNNKQDERANMAKTNCSEKADKVVPNEKEM